MSEQLPDALQEEVDAIRAEMDSGSSLTVGEVSCRLLAVVVEIRDVEGAEGDVEIIGASYLAVNEAVKSIYPNCSSTVKCLRWYSRRCREEGAHERYEKWEMPDRRPLPKPRPRKKKVIDTTK